MVSWLKGLETAGDSSLLNKESLETELYTPMKLALARGLSLDPFAKASFLRMTPAEPLVSLKAVCLSC